jgi:ComF family protein
MEQDICFAREIMDSVGKLLQRAARTLRDQPWLELVFPPNCASCQAELSSTRFVKPAKPDTILAPAENHWATTSGAVPVDVPASADGSSSLAFQEWQQLNWCDSCWKQIHQAIITRCRKCGAGLHRPNPLGERCANCLQTELRFDQAFAIGNYCGLLRELVVRMKNQHSEPLAIQLGLLLGYELLGHGWVNFDRVVAVPLHWSRRLKRGFQATDILCTQISKVTGNPKCSQTIRLVRSTAKQGTLSFQNRLANVRNAFQVHSKCSLEGKRILIVDDVLTSGATCSEIARILKLKGAAEVCVAVVVRGGLGY